MFSIQIRVDEGKKEELLEALNGLRQNIDFEFQAADEQHKQSVTNPGTANLEKQVNPKSAWKAQGGRTAQMQQPHQLSSNRAIPKTGRKTGKKRNQRQTRSLPN